MLLLSRLFIDSVVQDGKHQYRMHFYLEKEKYMRKDCICKLLVGLAIGLTSLVMFASLSSPLEAQSFYGSVVGTVTDASGAIIPGASVTLTNIGTNEKRSAETDAAGSYRFVNLVPANYRLEVEMAGFKRMTREPITVQVESAVRIDAALEVGAITRDGGSFSQNAVAANRIGNPQPGGGREAGAGNAAQWPQHHEPDCLDARRGASRLKHGVSRS